LIQPEVFKQWCSSIRLPLNVMTIVFWLAVLEFPDLALRETQVSIASFQFDHVIR